MDNFNYLLTVGPDFKNHRGGVGALIETYSKNLTNYLFLPSFKPYNNNPAKVLFFIKCVINFFYILLVNKKIKIIHIHGSQDGSFYRKYVLFVFGKYIFKKRVVYHIHGSHFDIFYTKSNKISRVLIKHFIENADCIFCLSNFWKTFFSNNFNIKRIEIIYNIVDISNSNNHLYTSDSNHIRLLFLGRIGTRKGIYDLVYCLKELKMYEKNKCKVTLYIGGDGEVEKLKNAIRQAHLEMNIEYVGWVNNDQKSILMDNVNIFVLPSYHEGLPISILESMSYGLPIISTKVGGIPEAVKDGHNGILIEPGDKMALKNAIMYFIDNPSEIERMGKASKEIVKKFYPETILPQLKKIYTDLLIQ